jgi:hypothetical protein
MLAIWGVSMYRMYRMYRHAHFHHINENLYLGVDDSWGRRNIVVLRTEIQDLECRMCLERIADCVPRFVAHPKGIMVNIQIKMAFVFFEGARNCKDFSVAILRAAGKA